MFKLHCDASTALNYNNSTLDKFMVKICSLA